MSVVARTSLRMAVVASWNQLRVLENFLFAPGKKNDSKTPIKQNLPIKQTGDCSKTGQEPIRAKFRSDPTRMSWLLSEF
jgi:hypothetical protein